MIKSDKEVNYKPSLIWPMVLFFVFIHLASFYGFYLSFYAKTQTHLTVYLLIVFGGLGVTAGAHRLWSHGAYKAKLPLRIFLAALQTLSLQRDIYEWCRDHRIHHKFCETDADPHDARRGFFYSHIGWLIVQKHPMVSIRRQQIDYSDLLSDPVVRYQRTFYIPLVILLGVVIPTLIPYYFWSEDLIISLFTCFFLRYVISLHIAFCINSVAHMYGQRPYDKHINSRDSLGLALTAMGEGFHNYHHTFPQDYSTSEWGWKFNLTTFFIDICAYLGLAYNLKTMDKQTIAARKLRSGDKIN
ncbi:stearoyl-CoA desaturase 5 [Tetranychus urticae]|uniref:Fatty acid desaturase domain-containing protein n=1 Tax=Tetranychus urticae TaxID=32264 RepID=T1KQX0_TETUR|nr:stearoyl-CoA desaturase 5 [Tetranychus urticae]